MAITGYPHPACPENGDRAAAAPTWRKSSHSGGGGGECVEVATARTLHLVRDSKHPDGPALTFTHPEWAAFLTAVKAGTYDR